MSKSFLALVMHCTIPLNFCNGSTHGCACPFYGSAHDHEVGYSPKSLGTFVESNEKNVFLSTFSSMRHIEFLCKQKFSIITCNFP